MIRPPTHGPRKQRSEAAQVMIIPPACEKISGSITRHPIPGHRKQILGAPQGILRSASAREQRVLSEQAGTGTGRMTSGSLLPAISLQHLLRAVRFAPEA